MINAAVVGFGNIGKSVLDALAAAPDFTVAGVVSRSAAPRFSGRYSVVPEFAQLGGVDVAILCSPSRAVPDLAAGLLEKGVCTVDSFDIHSGGCLRPPPSGRGGKGARRGFDHGRGWDPGTDSMVRALMEAMAPKGLTYTNFGPGMSMGHTVAVKAIDGVKNALSMTIPLGTGIHRRMVYVELQDNADFKTVAAAIKKRRLFSVMMKRM